MEIDNGHHTSRDGGRCPRFFEPGLSIVGSAKPHNRAVARIATRETQHSALSTQHSPQHSALSTQHSPQHSALSTQHSAWYLLPAFFVLALTCHPADLALAQTPASQESPGVRAPASSAPTTHPAVKKPDPRVLRWSRAMFLTLVLLVIFLFSALAIMVFSRRYQAYLARGRRRPTPSEDVWSMHQLPPDSDAPPDPDSPSSPDAPPGGNGGNRGQPPA